MVIDVATKMDVPALVELLNHLFSQEADFFPDPETQQRGLIKILDNQEVGTILVAREGCRVVGMVNLLYTISTALGDRVALLEDMIVAPDRRALGVGTQLLEAAIDLVTRQGCRRITLLTDADNDAARRFYLRHGFKNSSMLALRRPLADCRS